MLFKWVYTYSKIGPRTRREEDLLWIRLVLGPLGKLDCWVLRASDGPVEDVPTVRNWPHSSASATWQKWSWRSALALGLPLCKSHT